MIQKALNENKIPIIAPLGLGKNNQTYNINGDTAASAIAKKLKSRRLILMTNIEGVLNKEKILNLIGIDYLKNKDDYEINLIFDNNSHIVLTTEMIEVRLEDQNEIK